MPYSQGIKFLTRLRFGLTHLREPFKHSFQDSLNHYVSVVLKLKQLHIFCSTVPFKNNYRSSLLSTIRNIDCKLLENTDPSLTQTLLYGNLSLDIITNSLILNATIDSILSTERFEEALF